MKRLFILLLLGLSLTWVTDLFSGGLGLPGGVIKEKVKKIDERVKEWKKEKGVLPATPSNLSATAISSSQINFSWQDNSNNETGFKIERKTGSGGSYSEIATVGANVTAYSDTGLIENTTYFYRIRAYNTTGDSAYSNETSATTTIVFADDFEDGNYDGWTPGSDPFTRQVTNQTAAGGNYSFTMIGGYNNHYQGVSHTLANLTPQRIDFYAQSNNSSKSDGYFVVGKGPSIEETAVFFYMKDDATMGIYDGALWHGIPYVANQWYKISFIFDWTTKKVDYYVNDNLAESGISFRGTDINNLTDVYLYNYYDSQAWWDEIRFIQTGESVPATPSNLSAAAISSSQINLSWQDNSNNETGFKIERKTGVGGSYSEIATVGANVTAYSNTGLSTNTTYYYRVKAYNGAGDSGYSNEASATTTEGGWTTIMSEGFEGSFPSAKWIVSDGDGATNGEYYWDDDDYKPHSGAKSAWCAKGGANGLDPAYNNYPNNCQSYMIYGQFNLSDAQEARLSFYYWNKSESNNDLFTVWAWDGTNLDSCLIVSGSGNDSWNYKTVDLKSLPNVSNKSSVSIVFNFWSNSTVTDKGAFVDDILLEVVRK